MPGVGFGGAADVKVDELVQQGLEHVAAADPGVGGDREPELGRDGEADSVRAAAGAAHLQPGASGGERAVGEDGQGAETVQLAVEGDAGDLVVGSRARARRPGWRRRARRGMPTVAQPSQTWHRGHQ